MLFRIPKIKEIKVPLKKGAKKVKRAANSKERRGDLGKKKKEKKHKRIA